MKTEVSATFLQKHTICLYPEPDESNPLLPYLLF